MTEMQGVETTTTIDPNMVILPHLVGDMEICCDFAEHASCPKEGAAWVMHTVRCACGQGGCRLSCGPCKDLRINSEDGSVKCEGCGYVTSPARLAYSMIEALK